MLIEIKEIAREADSFSLGAVDQEQQQKLMHWQDQINASIIKHRVGNIAELRTVFEQLQDKVGSVSNLSEEIERLQSELLKQKRQLEQQAIDLHQRRQRGAPLVSKTLQQILDGLKLPHTTLSFDLEQSEVLNHTGFTQIQLLFSANLGHQPVAVEKAASGGELSRLMLALQKMVSEKKALPTIIFDEIDTGVSGEVALKMASLLQEMSANGQCIAITHLPQVAAKASHHFKVSKAVNTDRMQTSVETLDASARRLEIARLMSGEEVTKAALAHADNLMRN
jgi:DNA repair protein RecN (Recombination protein N)